MAFTLDHAKRMRAAYAEATAASARCRSGIRPAPSGTWPTCGNSCAEPDAHGPDHRGRHADASQHAAEQAAVGAAGAADPDVNPRNVAWEEFLGETERTGAPVRRAALHPLALFLGLLPAAAFRRA